MHWQCVKSTAFMENWYITASQPANHPTYQPTNYLKANEPCITIKYKEKKNTKNLYNVFQQLFIIVYTHTLIHTTYTPVCLSVNLWYLLFLNVLATILNTCYAISHIQTHTRNITIYCSVSPPKRMAHSLLFAGWFVNGRSFSS